MIRPTHTRHILHAYKVGTLPCLQGCDGTWAIGPMAVGPLGIECACKLIATLDYKREFHKKL